MNAPAQFEPLEERCTAEIISFIARHQPGPMSGINIGIGLGGLINGGPQIAAAKAELVHIAERQKAEIERHQPPGSLGAARAPQTRPDVSPDLPFHPAAELFELMDDVELEVLAADLVENGQQEPIRTLDGMIIIGRNRFRACSLKGLTPWIEPYSEGFNGDPRSLVISSNRHRKHLTPALLAWTALSLVETSHGGDRKRNSSKSVTYAEAAALMSVGVDQVRKAAAVDKLALPEIKAAIRSGKIAKIGHAFNIVTPDNIERLDGLTSEQKQIQWLNNPASGVGGVKKLSNTKGHSD